MLQEQYITMIGELVNATRAKALKWGQSTANRYQFFTNPTKEQKILVDRYFALGVEGSQTPCVNLTIFSHPDDQIIDEIVLCESAEDASHFQLLTELYEEAQKQTQQENSEKIKPILTHITESLQRLNRTGTNVVPAH